MGAREDRKKLEARAAELDAERVVRLREIMAHMSEDLNVCELAATVAGSDAWARVKRDYDVLIEAMVQLGASKLDRSDYDEALSIIDRCVQVGFRV